MQHPFHVGTVFLACTSYRNLWTSNGIFPVATNDAYRCNKLPTVLWHDALLSSVHNVISRQTGSGQWWGWDMVWGQCGYSMSLWSGLFCLIVGHSGGFMWPWLWNNVSWQAKDFWAARESAYFYFLYKYYAIWQHLALTFKQHTYVYVNTQKKNPRKSFSVFRDFWDMLNFYFPQNATYFVIF